MKTVFKASLLASAMVLAMGAQAATVSSTAKKLSAEGVAQGVTATAQELSFDIVVDNQHPSGSTITLTFDSNVDLGAAAAAAGGAVTNTPGSGTGVSGDIAFAYGTGSFTFDNVVIDKTTNPNAQTISFQVNLGNPLTADSAFRVYIDGSGVVNVPDGTGLAIVKGGSTLSYSAKNASGTVIETGTGVIATTATQFGFSVTTELDQLIDRVNRNLFVTAPTNVDTVVATWTNNENMPAALTGVDANLKLNGNFTGVAAGEFVAVAAPVAVNTTTVAGVAPFDFVNFDFVSNLTTAGAANTITATFTKASAATVLLPQTGDVSAVMEVTAANGVPGTVLKYSDDAGQWQLDASIVNVPYLPVGYGLSPNVEISNEGSTDAEIMVEGFDQFGTEYPATTLSFMAKKSTVTKVSEADIQAAFGLATTDKRKLSVTFVLDADADKITLAPYYKEGTSRVNVMSSQYKGK